MRFNKRKAIHTAEAKLKAYYIQKFGGWPDDVPFWRRLFKNPYIREDKLARKIRRTRGMKAVRLVSYLYSQGLIKPRLAL